MARLHELLRQVAQKDKQLADDLRAEVRALEQRRAFGLNFERHVPESVELPGRPVRRGDKVRFLPARGEPASSVEQGLWRVQRIRSQDGRRVAELLQLGHRPAGSKGQAAAAPTASRSVDDLVVVAEFRDPIYPGFKSTGKVERGGSKPYHSVINAENFHALQALLYTHAGKVDAIYIDPPYNTGAKDWKYNNDYVDGEDAYRHSKWLAFMERRLKVAKRLLNPDNSVLICTIDEREYLRLGLLLEQTFSDARILMLSSVINPKGVPRHGFSRVDEYIFFVQLGSSEVTGEIKSDSEGKPVRWRGLTRSGANGIRSKSPGAFYPIYLNKEGKIEDVGEALPLGQPATALHDREGLTTVWPTPRPTGEDGRWSVVPETLKNLIEIGAVRVGKVDFEKGQFPISYLTSNQLSAIKRGELETQGTDKDGVMQVFYPKGGGRVSAPRTIWDNVSHSASDHGSTLLKSFLPNRRFPYPKSLYAVEDTLRFFIADKPNAIILDFFSGSGTTAHAVMRLNKQDDGRRQCILVTNNEVSADEQAALRKKGLRPGDAEWEQWGICDYITKPRIKAAITGKTPEGKPIKGDYKFTDEFPMADGFEENVEFFTMTYEDALTVEHNQAFGAIAPLLWLKAGAQGSRIEQPTDDFALADRYGVLFDLDAAHVFLQALAARGTVRMAFVVTDDDFGFQRICADLPERVEPVRLYESYLSNFRINGGLVA